MKTQKQQKSQKMAPVKRSVSASPKRKARLIPTQTFQPTEDVLQMLKAAEARGIKRTAIINRALERFGAEAVQQLHREVDEAWAGLRQDMQKTGAKPR